MGENDSHDPAMQLAAQIRTLVEHEMLKESTLHMQSAAATWERIDARSGRIQRSHPPLWVAPSATDAEHDAAVRRWCQRASHTGTVQQAAARLVEAVDCDPEQRAPARTVRMLAKMITENLARDTATDDNDALSVQDALDWRRTCDEAYADGIVARQAGIGPDDHGMNARKEPGRSLAQAFALGWRAADEVARTEDVVAAAAAHLRHGDAGTREALRDALLALAGTQGAGEAAADAMRRTMGQ